jgi:hypothetical protein
MKEDKGKKCKERDTRYVGGSVGVKERTGNARAH